MIYYVSKLRHDLPVFALLFFLLFVFSLPSDKCAALTPLGHLIQNGFETRKKIPGIRNCIFYVLSRASDAESDRIRLALLIILAALR